MVYFVGSIQFQEDCCLGVAFNSWLCGPWQLASSKHASQERYEYQQAEVSIICNLITEVKSLNVARFHWLKTSYLRGNMTQGSEYWEVEITQDHLTDCFPGGSVVKNLPANAGDVDLIPGLGRSPGEGNGNPLQYSCLEISMDREAWWVLVHGVARFGHDSIYLT